MLSDGKREGRRQRGGREVDYDGGFGFSGVCGVTTFIWISVNLYLWIVLSFVNWYYLNLKKKTKPNLLITFKSNWKIYICNNIAHCLQGLYRDDSLWSSVLVLCLDYENLNLSKANNKFNDNSHKQPVLMKFSISQYYILLLFSLYCLILSENN